MVTSSKGELKMLPETQIYKITGLPGKRLAETIEQELCSYHADRWSHAGYPIEAIKTRTKALWHGAEACYECEWCEAEAEGKD